MTRPLSSASRWRTLASYRRTSANDWRIAASYRRIGANHWRIPANDWLTSANGWPTSANHRRLSANHWRSQRHNSFLGENHARPDRSPWLFGPVLIRSASDLPDLQLGFLNDDLAKPVLRLQSRANENSRRPNRPNRPRPCADRPQAARKKLRREGRTLLLSGAPPLTHDLKQRRNRRVHWSSYVRQAVAAFDIESSGNQRRWH